MPESNSQSTKTAPLLHLVNRNKASTVAFEADVLTVWAKSGRIAHTVRADEILEVRLRKLPLLNQLTVLTKLGRTVTVNGLERGTSERLHSQLQTRVEEILNDEATRKASALGPRIADLRNSITSCLAPDWFIRHSHAAYMTRSTKELAEQLDERSRQKLTTEGKQALRWLESATNPEALEGTRAALNETFLAAAVPNVQEATKDMQRNGLTDEQARNIAADEDATLILAGAGTGKTAVITGKIAHLVRYQGAPPESILALAFNRKAALEIRERLPDDLKGAHVSTFHSFALRVVASQGTAPTISKLSQDNFAYNKAINGILAKMMTDPDMARNIIRMAGTFSTEYREPFDFETPLEYEQYVYDAELRTLNKELVKSFEELTVANWLAMNGVKYTYEKPYEFLTATREYRQYQPDFHLPDHGIHIEHFALNEEGQAPPGWTTYAQEAQWKRDLHARHQTTLIETYSWQHRRGVLESSLEVKLREQGVEFNPLPAEELVQKLSKERVSRLSSLLGTFLNHAKSSNLTHEEILDRAKGQKDNDRTQCFLEIFKRVREEYEILLGQEDTVDFHDLINRATEVITEGHWENPFRYVLIDEFQDISNGRMNLAQALKKPDLTYFLVGDDWQSIYRFAGSYVGLIHQVADHLGFTRRESLTKTFRFGDGILGPSTRFVQQNPEQTRRKLEANDPEAGLGITVIPADLPETGLHQALREIEEITDGGNDSIMVLGRYRNSRSALGRSRGIRNLEFNTVHSTKGQEADYVVILDLKDDRYGFPCMVEDDPLLTIVMPPTHGEPFPFAEERRLFYVALTRARKAVYLITDPVRPSPFAREMLKNCPEVQVRDGMRPPCPACEKGALVPSQSGDNLRCSNFPRCQHLAPRCSGCRGGYVSITEGGAECSNPGCEAPPEICKRCREGILVLRSGHSKFWGCSRYQSDPSCTYTRAAEEEQGQRDGRQPAYRSRRRHPRHPARRP